MIHERFDLDRWKAEFSLARLRAKARSFVLNRKEQSPSQYSTDEAVERHIRLMEPGGTSITGPSEMAVVEQIRQEVFAADPTALEPRLPTDAFVFGRGEPLHRQATKIGGLPYRPRSRPWPHTKGGTPMQFAAQVCFADSYDIVGSLPGDVLLVFFDYDEYYSDLDSAALHLEWAKIDGSDLVTEEDIPESEYNYTPYYAQIHRTYDYPDAEPRFANYGCSYQLNVIEGTKIGGVPRWVQDDPGLPGRFLCAIGSINPTWYEPYPFLNAPEPHDESYKQPEKEYDLMWGDVGSLYVFLDDQGKLHWDVQFY
jgi:Domain of unknown function (DUF1963)